VSSASLVSLPEGSFQFDPLTKIGEWTLIQMPDAAKLQGSVRGFCDSLIATVSLRVQQHAFSASQVEKVTCSLTGGKDDPGVFKGVKTSGYLRNLEYRLS